MRFAVQYFKCGGLSLDLLTFPYPAIRDRSTQILTRKTTCEHPSVFKRLSAFTLAFVECAPIPVPMKGSQIWPQITELPNHQNILTAIEFSLFSLMGATIEHATRGTLVVDVKPRISRHFLTDLVQAISCGGSADFHWLSLVYEAIVYKENRGIEDPDWEQRRSSLS